MAIVDATMSDHLKTLREENARLREALKFIAAMKGMTLIAPSLGPDGDNAHQLGASKAFNQSADTAIDALKE